MKRDEFDILTSLLKKEGLSRRELAERLGCSLGKANGIVAKCVEVGWIKNGQVTAAGRRALAPYKVDNAIIMAA